MKKNLTNFDLKLIAIITMTIDHIGAIIYNDIDIFRIIGRISFPIFAFLLVEGFKKSNNRLKYFLRLIIFAFITQPVYDYVFKSNTLNILFTFSLGFLLMMIIEFSKKIIDKYNKGLESYLYKTVFYSLFYILFSVLAIFLNVDYTVLGITTIFIFYLSPNILLSFILYFLSVVLLKTNDMQMYSIISFFFLYLYNGKRGRNLKYFFYLYYPLHLLLLKMLLVM